MGTRGAYGFQKDGVRKLTYSHYDSYPDSLGNLMLDFIRENSVESMNDAFDKITMVKDNEIVPVELQAKYKHLADTSVSSGKLDEWYVLLRETQGNLSIYTSGECEHMIDNGSLSNDYSYIINLDTKELELYHWGKLTERLTFDEIADSEFKF